jgi:RsiW-degrading membrane proteinase PrsW (M82 family)
VAPGKYLALAFAAGAASAGLASVGELALGLDFSFQAGDIGPATFILVTLVAPLVEECVKPIGVYLINKEDSPDLRVRDWATLGLFAGLGFALLEDVLYAVNMLPNGTESALALMAIRLLLPLHLLASMLVGVGVGMYRRSGRPADFAVMLVPAVCLHALFNFVAVTV